MFIKYFSKKGSKWRTADKDKFLRSKNLYIKHKKPFYNSHYYFVDKECTKVIFDHYALDFDVDNLEDVPKAFDEVNNISRVLSDKYDVNISIIDTTNRGYHCLIFFPAIKLPKKIVNQLHEVFYNLLIDVFEPKFLCPSCIKPAGRVVRCINSYHESTGEQVKIIKEYKGKGKERLDLLIQKKLIDIISTPKQPKEYIKSSSNDGLFDLNIVDLKDVYKDVGNHLIVDDNSDHLVIKHPVHLETRSDSNGVVGSYCSTCYSTNETFNKWDSLMQIFNNNKSKLIEYLIEKYPTRKSNV
jgi:hypothetical protein